MLYVVKRKGVATYDIADSPKKGKSLPEVRWWSDFHIAVNDKCVVDVDEERQLHHITICEL